MKTVLLIGGGGTLGTHTAAELLRLGCRVDILCPEEKVSTDERLTFYRGYATVESLTAHFEARRYDGIVNFLHYPDVTKYPPYHELLMKHTDHLIVLSSYRTYADLQHPVTETAPHLIDVSTDETFLQTEQYAVSKGRLERYLNDACKGQPWTVVRPVISFSQYRLDLITYSGHTLIDKVRAGEVIPLPIEAKDRTAGLDWAGNSGKLIAHLLFKPETYGEAYTVSSAQNLTWGEVADLYAELLGAAFRWVPLKEYLHATDWFNYYALIYDRHFDRRIDNTKILKATGLTDADFLPLRDALRREIDAVKGTEEKQ